MWLLFRTMDCRVVQYPHQQGQTSNINNTLPMGREALQVMGLDQLGRINQEGIDLSEIGLTTCMKKFRIYPRLNRD